MTTTSQQADVAGTTMRLSESVVGWHSMGLPKSVRREAERALVNVLATAIGASQSDAVGILMDYAREEGGQPKAPVAGRAEWVDPVMSALINGTAAHYDDFDDTHLMTVIHPSAAAMGAVLAMASWRGSSGKDVLSAFALGCEVQLRIGVAMSPSHYDRGWHITGTCGNVGAGIAAGLLAGLPAHELCRVVGVAASQTLGHREAFGTMTKPFHPGRAAANGLIAALLVEEGLSAPVDVVEASAGMPRTLSDASDESIHGVADGFGDRWELLSNTYKPYPGGIVSHPAIDAAIELAPKVKARDIASVTVSCHPLVVELTGNPDPTDGLEARFSTSHGVAAGLVDGRVGLAQYQDGRVQSDDLRMMRATVELQVDDSLERNASRVEVTCHDGSKYRAVVSAARGSLEKPLTDAELREKVDSLVAPVLPGRTAALFDAVGALTEQDDTADLIRAIVPAVSEFRPGVSV